MNRRSFLGALATTLGGALLGCGGPARPKAPTDPELPLSLNPMVDLAPSAGLAWLVDLRPRVLAASPALIPAVATLVPEQRFDTFAAHHGGFDLRRASELVIASYRRGWLVLASGSFDPARLEAAFTERASPIEARGVVRASEAGRPLRPVVSLHGTSGKGRERLAIFGPEGFGWEQSPLGGTIRGTTPLDAAVAFAQRRLKKSKPALKTAPLERAASHLAGAPARFFAPGPFDEGWERGFAGLLGASTGIGFAAWPVVGPPDRLELRGIVLGAWGDKADAAASRLGAAFQLLAEDPLGRLCGLDRPVRALRTHGTADALTLDVGLDPLALARGLHAATAANVDEIMAY